MKKLSILGGRIIDPRKKLDFISDIHIVDGKIFFIGKGLSGFEADLKINAEGLVVAPGLVDINVALRDPGSGKKGDIISETLAASAGGVTSLCCTPNTTPSLDTIQSIAYVTSRSREHSSCKVFPIGALTKDLKGENISELNLLKESGCIAFTDGLYDFKNNKNLKQVFEYASTFDLIVIIYSLDYHLSKGGLVHEGAVSAFRGLTGIPETAETVALSKNLLLVEQTGVRAHFTQLTSARSANLIADAQSRGLRVTADVALYQLILTDQALMNFSSLYHVLPPLRSEKDREELKKHIRLGTIQAISSHHQPHEQEEKIQPFGQTKPGISSIELLLPLAMTLVKEDVLDLPTLLARLSIGPSDALDLGVGAIDVGSDADLVLFDMNTTTIGGNIWHSKGRNCPFMYKALPGSVCYTIVNGIIRYQK